MANRWVVGIEYLHLAVRRYDVGSTSVYFDERHEVLFELFDEVSKTGVARKGADLWFQEKLEVDIDQVEQAVKKLDDAGTSIDEVVEDVKGVDEFVNKANEIQA